MKNISSGTASILVILGFILFPRGLFAAHWSTLPATGEDAFALQIRAVERFRIESQSALCAGGEVPGAAGKEIVTDSGPGLKVDAAGLNGSPLLIADLENVNRAFSISRTTGYLGIGTEHPAGRLHLKSKVAEETVPVSNREAAAIFEIPTYKAAQIPPGGDDTYRVGAAMQWQGGEPKYGIWRQYFNTYEHGWTLAYNVPVDVTENKYGPRDKNGISAVARFNVAEGDSGQNTFEVQFAPPGPAGTVPDIGIGGGYLFYDGKQFCSKANRCPAFQLAMNYPEKYPPLGPGLPAKFVVRAPQNMQAVVELSSEWNTEAPSQFALTADTDRSFKIQKYTGSPLPNAIQTLVTIKASAGSSGNESFNVGIGTTAPAQKLEVAAGNISLTSPGSGILLRSPDGTKCASVQLSNAGALVPVPIACP